MCAFDCKFPLLISYNARDKGNMNFPITRCLEFFYYDRLHIYVHILVYIEKEKEKERTRRHGEGESYFSFYRPVLGDSIDKTFL